MDDVILVNIVDSIRNDAR